MFSLMQGINYFDKDEALNKECLEEYSKIKKSDSLSESNNNDLLFFNPEEFDFEKREEIYSMNQYMLADYMDILYLDEKSNKEEINKTVEYFENYATIFNSLFENSSIKKENIGFKYAQKINKLIENFKSDLLNSDITEMYISSGSVHAMKYSLVFDILTEEEKEKIKRNLQNRKITIIYGPFALLEDDNNNKFIKFLFEELDNRDNIFIQRDNNKEYKRIHFSYKKYKDGKQTIIIETPHREYLMRRNYIELDITDFNFNDLKSKCLFNDNMFKDTTNIKSYEKFIEKSFLII